jgi:hypothetical protein
MRDTADRSRSSQAEANDVLLQQIDRYDRRTTFLFRNAILPVIDENALRE